MLIQIRGENCGPRKAAALFRHLGGIAPNHIFHRMTFEPVSLFERVQYACRQPRGGHFMQAAILAAFTARGTNGVVDIGICHRTILFCFPLLRAA